MTTKPHMHGGVIVPMISPFNPDGTIDTAAARKMALRMASHSISVFLLGTSGESASIQRTERLRLVQSVAEAVGGKVPVYAGIGDNCFSNAVEAANKYLDCGVTAVVAHLPSYYPLGESDMMGYFELLHDRINGPLILYNIPVTTRMSLPLSLIEKLSQLPKVIGFKDSERDEERMADIAARFGGRDDFALFMGTAALSAAALRIGFHGMVPNSGNLIPAIWQQLYTAAMHGDWQTVDQLQARADRFAHVFQGNRNLAESLAALKVLLEHEGLCQSHVLPPLRRVNGVNRDQLVAAYRELLAGENGTCDNATQSAHRDNAAQGTHHDNASDAPLLADPDARRLQPRFG